MKKYLIIILCVSCIALVNACNTVNKINQQKKLISATLLPKDSKQFKFGQLTESLLTLKNLTDNAMVITQVYIGSDGNSVTLSNSVYGSIDKSDESDIYSYHPLAQHATQLPFYVGFLLPNQEVSVSYVHRALTENESLKIEYVLSYAKYDGTPNSLKPFNVYLSSKNDNQMVTEFHLFNENKWLDICHSMPNTHLPGPDAPLRAVIIPGLRYSDEPSSPPDENEAELKTQNSLIGIGIEDRDKIFPIESARKIAYAISGTNNNIKSIGYSIILGGYVVSEKDLSWLLQSDKQKERGALLPIFPLSLLEDMDKGNYVKIKIGDKQEGLGPEEHKANRNFWDTYQVFYGDGMYTQGEFIHINKTELFNFLKKVKGKDMAITQHKYFFRSRYYVLQMPKE